MIINNANHLNDMSDKILNVPLSRGIPLENQFNMTEMDLAQHRMLLWLPRPP